MPFVHQRATPLACKISSLIDDVLCHRILQLRWFDIIRFPVPFTSIIKNEMCENLYNRTTTLTYNVLERDRLLAEMLIQEQTSPQITRPSIQQFVWNFLRDCYLKHHKGQLESTTLGCIPVVSSVVLQSRGNSQWRSLKLDLEGANAQR
jgi:hypothetical protein